MFGLGIVEKFGLLVVLFKWIVGNVKGKLLLVMVVFVGVMSSLVVDVGYVVLILLVGIIFVSVGKYFLVGMVVVFVGVFGGYSVNFLVGFIDVVLVGIFIEVV